MCDLQWQQSGSAAEDSATCCRKLKEDLRSVFNVLPKDIQELLLLNPQREAILQVKN